ncbi:CNPV210 N1R/p28-like protein [Canarypox virus]|uniref:CNPV210 N1R/p28-like protein n=1 Tax=Canarypox virus TaxID=44088 RepID=Q6VZD7_CNPV|nr:CNPV210 N1R/p28-like protein [Canarypox virus]AAR83556.1 CNPV210 N1R/p28-like protein [Canarypox virus]AWD84686.1 N1R/p28-like protein [Canarypox virus]
MYNNHYNIATDIDDTYSYIYYGKLKVIVMKDCGYFNATKICSHFNKEFHNWQRFESSKCLTDVINKIIRPNKCLINIPSEYGRDNCTSGTYVHPLLFPHVLSWLSFRYAIQISKIINNMHSRMYYMKKIET